MDIGSRKCSALPAMQCYAHLCRYDVNSHFGTADDLKSLAKALHDRGMYLMLDVVANHMVCVP